MPMGTKILFGVVVWGLAVFVVLAFMHGATSKPTPQAPVSDQRYRKLWVVDREETLDNDRER